MSEPSKAVFLSYASQDAEAVKKIADALRAAGVEVWFDAEGGLEHGDEWDAKIRRQIKECALFLPVISANTQAREEGYFRIEWELAAQRALGIASGVAFILPIVIDDTREPDALVPDRFRSVQWTRLRGGELTPEVKARFLKLWSHRTGALKQAAAVAAEVAPAPVPPRRRIILPWIVLGLLAIVAAWFIFKPRRSPEELAKVVADAQKLAAAVTPPAPATPPVSEARQLLAKARALFEALDCTRDDYKLAEELIAQAKTREPMDAEVSATEAQLHGRYLSRGWDVSDTRREAARAATQRAIRLDPQSFEARIAQAGLLGDSGDATEKERQLRELRRERPTDQRVLRMLASVLDRSERIDEAAAIADESAALPGGDPVALYSKSLGFWFADRPVEAETAMQASLAQRPFAGARLMAAWYRLALHGDLEGARGFITRIEPAQMIEDRAAFFAFFLEYLAHRPDAAIARLQAVPRDWLNDFWFRGPKGWLVGDALNSAGRHDAAVVEWTAALKLVEQRLAASPNNPPLIGNRVGLLIRLGQREEAERQLAVLRQMKSEADISSAGSVAKSHALLGHKAEAIKTIAAGLKVRSHAVVFPSGLLRLDPVWDSLRGEPEFESLITEAETLERGGPATATAPPPRDWPKDPELKQAMNLAEGQEAIPDDLALAEEITKRVLDRSPTDLEAVTVMARVQSHYLRRGFDRSDERAALAKRYAERALQLGPNEPEAMYALATYHFSRGTGETARTEQLLRRAMELDRSNPRPGRLLADLLNVTNRQTEAITQGQDNIRRFPHDVLSHYDLARNFKDQARYVEFDRELDATLALAPLPNAIVWKARLQFGLRNDFAGMKAWLDRVPARVRGTERAVFGYFLYAAFGGDPEAGLAALRDFPQKWFTDFEYAGPTALLNATLLELQGKQELARRQYEAAQGEILRMRQTDPGRIGLSQVEFWTLLGLGRAEEAKASHRRMVEGLRKPYAQDMVNGWWFTAIPGSLLIGDRTTALALLRESVATLPASREGFRLRFQIDPRMAPFRDDPEIKAILADPADKPAAAPAKVDEKSVAVLAFANLSDDKANEYFSDGISEELLNVLAKIPGLTVRGRSSGFYFKGKQVKSAEIGQQLNVSYLVQGSVRRAGDRVRISAQLIRAATDEVVWSSGSLDRDLKDIFAVQDEIAGLIAKNLSLKMGVTARAPHQVNPEALTALLEGRHFWALRTAEGFARAGELFNRAVTLDPEWAPAHAALASLLAIEALYRKGAGESVGERMTLATREARRAIELDPTLGEPHAALGKIAMEGRRRTEAEQEFNRALELEPNNAQVLDWHGDLMVMQGRLDVAIAEYRRAAELEPLSPYILLDLAWELTHVRRYSEALALVERASTLMPAGSARLTLRRAQILLGLGRNAEAEAAVRVYLENLRTGSDPQFGGPEAVWCLKALSSPADFQRWTAELLRQYPDSFTSGVILLMLGREEEAFPLLEKLPMIFWQQLYWESIFDPVRDTPRFRQLLEKLGCVAEYKVARETRARLLKEQEARK